MSIFASFKAVWAMLFGFFPSWFQVGIVVVFGLFLFSLVLHLVKFIKDLIWPF